MTQAFLLSAIGHFWLMGSEGNLFVEAVVKAVTKRFPQASAEVLSTWAGVRWTVILGNGSTFVADQSSSTNLLALQCDGTDCDCPARIVDAITEAVGAFGDMLQGSYGPVIGADQIKVGTLSRQDSGRVKCYRAGILHELAGQLLKVA